MLYFSIALLITPSVLAQQPANPGATITALCSSANNGTVAPTCSIYNTYCIKSSNSLCSGDKTFPYLASMCAGDFSTNPACTPIKTYCAGAGAKDCQKNEFIEMIPDSKTTTQLINGVPSGICTEMKMSACKNCPAPDATGISKCDLFKTYSDLCISMPEMNQCSSIQKLCAKTGSPAEYCPTVATTTGAASPTQTKTNGSSKTLGISMIVTGVLGIFTHFLFVF
ncbi:hypothetical protein BC833DRAFT_584759 [Globomyces pollinis-pini]|nr:hypothetical protein BC833DRAFT_584759 [Globomyces pollinis-pini]KAJ2997089.1 hypothetical protein HDV02_005903 [Globomyces sp. JEL0801]